MKLDGNPLRHVAPHRGADDCDRLEIECIDYADNIIDVIGDRILTRFIGLTVPSAVDRDRPMPQTKMIHVGSEASRAAPEAVKHDKRRALTANLYVETTIIDSHHGHSSVPSEGLEAGKCESRGKQPSNRISAWIQCRIDINSSRAALSSAQQVLPTVCC
jgi:hypothetical protein